MLRWNDNNKNNNGNIINNNSYCLMDSLSLRCRSGGCVA